MRQLEAEVLAISTQTCTLFRGARPPSHRLSEPTSALNSFHARALRTKGGPMNRLCWRASLLACALFSGGLALAQFPGYTAMSRYSYNPMTGTTTQSQGYYNPYTGAGGRSVSVSNPYTGGADMA